MSARAELHIDGYIFPLKKFKWGFSQGTNYDGNPSNKIRQKMLYLSLDMIRDELFEAWAYANFMKKDFEIHIIPTILGSGRTRIIKCFEAFLVEFETTYHHQSKEQTTYHCKITCGRYETNTSTAVFRENWAQKPLTANTPVYTSIENDEPNFIKKHLEDLNGNIISKNNVDIDEEFFLVLQTENAINETMSVDLNDSSKDYEYNGVHMKDDIIRNILITDDLTKVKLKAVPQQ